MQLRCDLTLQLQNEVLDVGGEVLGTRLPDATVDGFAGAGCIEAVGAGVAGLAVSLSRTPACLLCRQRSFKLNFWSVVLQERLQHSGLDPSLIQSWLLALQALQALA